MAAKLELVVDYEGELLHSAAIYNEVDFLDNLLNAGVHGSVHSTDKRGLTPLHTAALHGSTDSVRLLLKREADANAISGLEDNCSTPLHHAAKNGHLECLRVLLDYEADLELKNSKGETAYDVANEKGFIDCCQFLLDVRERQRLEYEEAQREELYDLVVYGNFYGAQRIIRELCKASAKTQTINRFYRGPNTLLYKASCGGYKEIVELLLNHGADGRPNPDSGISPLYAAAFYGHLSVVELLSDRIPHLRTLKTITDETEPIHGASSHGHMHVVRYLLQYRGPVPSSTENPREQREEEHSDASATSFSSNETSAAFINVNTRNRMGFTPLHLASKNGHVGVVQELLKCGPILKGDAKKVPPHRLAIDIRNDAGHTALHCAIFRGWIKVLRLLLTNGADVNGVTTNEKITPLQMACRLGDEAMVKLLLDFGARDIDELARIESIRNGKERLAQILLGNGVFTDTVFKARLTAEEKALDPCPVLVAWHDRKLEVVRENWILDSVLLPNEHIRDDLLNNMSLRMKLLTTINLSSNSLRDIPAVIFQLTSLQKLDLSHNDLFELPTPRGQPDFDEVFAEDASSSSSSASAEFRTSERWNCPLLETLEVQRNRLASIPDCLFHLESLTLLDVSHNHIVSLPYDMWLAPNLKTLLLCGNRLRCLPSFPEDFEGGFLSSKIFSRSSSSLGSTFSAGDSTSSTDYQHPLSTSSTRISNRRPTWEESDDSSDQEDTIDHLEEKSGLDKLDVSDNKIYALPPGLACLAPNLARFNASGNQISEISGMWSLPATLSLLDLSKNSLTRFDLTNRHVVVDKMCYSSHQYSHQGLKKTSSFPQGLTQAGSNKVKLCKHRSHRCLLHLKQLNLASNKLEQLPLVVGSVPKQPGITEILFPELQSLVVSQNRLREVPLHIGKLDRLSSLVLSGNQIECLPPELGLCSGLYELRLNDLALRFPPRNVLEKKLITNGQMDVGYVTGFLKSVYENSKPYPHIKLMFVGLSNVGKTSLLELLRREGTGSYQLPGYQPGFHRRKRVGRERASSSSHSGQDPNVSTVGVEVCDWTYSKRHFMVTMAGPEVKFSTWDFGGQHEYYATHSCFLSRRALYLLLWKMTELEKGVDQLEPWLLNIQARAGNASVIIVGTHYDKLSPHYKKRGGYADKLHQMIMHRYVSEEYGGGVSSLTEKGLPRVLHVVEVSCKTEHYIRELRNLVYDTVLEMKNEDQASLMESLVPASYLRVEEAVTKICKRLEQEDKYPVLEDKYFRSAVESELQKTGYRLTRAEELDQAVKFLHGYGVLLHYEDPSLKDLYFVDPQWLCDMLAHVITVRNVNPYIRNGILKVSDLKNQIFRGERFPSSWVDKYIDLMSKFEVAIKISEKYLLVPSLLPEKQKDCPKVSESLYPEVRSAMDMYAYVKHKVYRRQYLMSYVPSGFWARLITRLIADNRVCRIVTNCCEITNTTATNEDEKKIEGDQLIRAAPPEWACWRTGIELSCFGAKLLRVCQLEKAITFYGATQKTNKPLLVDFSVYDHTQGYTIEILAPCIGLMVERFTTPKKTHAGDAKGTSGGTGEPPDAIGFRVVSVKDELRTSAQLLAIAVEHMDNLLADWYYALDSFVTATKRRLVQRVVPCPNCLQNAISSDPIQQEVSRETQCRPLETREKIVVETLAGRSEPAPPEQKIAVAGNRRGEGKLKKKAKEQQDGPESGRGGKKGVSTEKGVDSRKKSFTANNINSPGQDFARAKERGSEESVESHYKTKTASGDSTSGYSSEGDHSPMHGTPNGNTDTSSESSSPKADNCIFAFTFEDGVKRLNVPDPMCCLFHNEINMREIFPDVVFVDLPENFVISYNDLTKEKFLAAGSYGSVSKGKLRLQDSSEVTVAIKVPYDTDPGAAANTLARRDAAKNERFLKFALTDTSTTMYKSIRQELAILVPMKHEHIIMLLGVALSPLAMVIEFAPLGSLDQKLQDYKRAGRKLDPYVIQKCCIQVAQALRYLHRHNIIYRDLKSENILVWSFPEPSVKIPVNHTVFLKLADYGISRAVAISGTKGLGGTSGFMAPEIVYYFGKESYTLKVDSFSFGSFMYELIALHQPFYDIGSKVNLANQFVAEGKRPKLLPREKRTPVLILSLMYRCWAHNQDDRPSTNDIYGLASLKEFPRLTDAFDLNETFSFQCATISSKVGSADYADSRCVIGSVLWLCGFEGKEKKNSCVTVLSYSDEKRTVLKEIQTKLRIVFACAVGSTIWLGTDAGAILVHCALTYRPLALGKSMNQGCILSMLHSPVCHCVLVGVLNGSVFRYHDNVSRHKQFVSRADIIAYFDNVPEDVSIREIIPNDAHHGQLPRPIHCVAAVGYHYFDQQGTEEQFNTQEEQVKATTSKESFYDEPDSASDSQRELDWSSLRTRYELWCGQERGIITILDIDNINEAVDTLTLSPPEIKSAGASSVTVRYIDTLRTFEDDWKQRGGLESSQYYVSLEQISESVWVVLYPGTHVYRLNVQTRKVESMFDAASHSPPTDLNSSKTSKKTKALHDSKTKPQISSILVVDKDLYVGTTFGCLIVCDNQSLVPRIILRCYDESLECLMPLRMTSSRRDEGKHRHRLVLSGGKSCLDRWSRTHDRGKTRVLKDCTILTWLADQWEV